MNLGVKYQCIIFLCLVMSFSLFASLNMQHLYCHASLINLMKINVGSNSVIRKLAKLSLSLSLRLKSALELRL